MNENSSLYIERARLLYDQDRYEQAIGELHRALASDPDNTFARSLLANCLCELKKFPEAVKEAAEAIRLGPDDPYSHHTYAFVLMRQGHARQAEVVINEAIRLSPFDAHHLQLLSFVRMQQQNWRGALEAADRGLALAPYDVNLMNARSQALIKLGRSEESLQTVDAALSFEPNSAYSHANKGWSLLEAKDPTAALEHFREALRLDPTMDWAQRGMLIALKARYPLYRLVLGYYFWMSRLPRQVRYGIIIGLWLVNNLLRSLSQTYPALTPYVLPLSILYALFCYASWTIDPLFNTLLRFNPFGKYLLRRPQIATSNLVAGSFVAAVASFLVALVHPTEGWFTLGLSMIVFSVAGAATAKWREGLPDRWRTLADVVGPLLIVAALVVMSAGEGL